MAPKIQHKRSAVAGKAPQPADLDYGEIAVNYEASDPALYVKDSANAVRKIGTQPDATTTTKGLVQLADAAAVTAGTAGRVVDAAQLKAAVAAEDLWDRTGTEISPKTAGDSVFTSGALKVGGTTAAPAVKIDPGTATSPLVRDSSGRLGLGTSSPDVFSRGHTQILGISTASGNSALQINAASGSIGTIELGAGATRYGSISATSASVGIGTNAAIPLYLSTNNANRVTIDSSGNVGIGTTSPNVTGFGGTVATINVATSSNGGLELTKNNVAAGHFTVEAGASNDIRVGAVGGSAALTFQTAGNERGRFDSSGRLLVGTSTATGTAALQVAGAISTLERTVTAGAFDMGTGNFWTCGAITIPNPTNAVAGMSGLIRLTAAPAGWGTNFKHAGGSATAPKAFPAIVPFYVQSATVILVGKPVEGMA